MKNNIRLFVLSAFVTTCCFSQDLPKPTPEFKGKIETTYKTSTPDFPQPVTRHREHQMYFSYLLMILALEEQNLLEVLSQPLI